VLYEESALSGNAVMGRAANDNWPERQLLVVPHAGRGGSAWSDIQAEAQDQIGAALLAMYADLLQQPLSTRMVKLIRQIDTRLETSRHAG
jgi:surfactin synthase thioesterase subunit